MVTYVAAYFVAFGSIKLEQRYRSRTQRLYDLQPAPCQPWPRVRESWPAPSTQKSTRQNSDLTQLSGLFAYDGSTASAETSSPIATHQLLDLFIHTLPIWICGVLLLAVGLPIYLATGFDTPFESFYFILVWVCCHQLLRSLKASKKLDCYPGTRSTVVILANPVLLTSGFGTIYFWIKTVLTETTINQVITDFRRNSTLAKALTHITEDDGVRRYVGTGDAACVILDAGILCLGMKMFEYRRELAGSFYSVVSTCLIIATTSVFLNVMLARTMGLEAEEALAFAAKSVTIALGVPAIQKINGSTTLMSALCICSGMAFQMSGNLMFNVLRIDHHMLLEQSRHGNSSSDTEKAIPPGCHQDRNINSSREETKLLAAGVTVGINAAAMGTAHLIELDSTCIAYSALSMTIFGGLIVALTALPGVSDLLMCLATRQGSKQ